MDFAFFLIQLLNGLQYGLLLFLVASGLTLVFGIMGIINLAHGSFYMVGAYLAWSLASMTGSLPGTAYLAPGHSHLLVRRIGGHFFTELSRGEPVNRHRPSVDVLFHSVAEAAGAQALGVILTGMGKDGAPGMLAMHRAGAWTIAQDQASCVVYGMPREAVALGAVDETLPLEQVAARVVSRLVTAERACG